MNQARARKPPSVSVAGARNDRTDRSGRLKTHNGSQSSTPRQMPAEIVSRSSQPWQQDPKLDSSLFDQTAGLETQNSSSLPLYDSTGDAIITTAPSYETYTYSSARNPATTSSSSAGPYKTSNGGKAGESSQEGSTSKTSTTTEFKRRDRAFFNTLGRMFVIVWSEPASEGTSTAHINAGARGQPVFQKQRYFVVLRSLPQHCLALAVHTHQSQGVARVARKEQYGIIHTGSIAPRPTLAELPRPGQLPMQPEPVRVLPDLNEDALDPMSRLNYAKVYTIEHRIPVKPFGIIESNSRMILSNQLRNVLGMDIGPQQAPQPRPQQPLQIQSAPVQEDRPEIVPRSEIANQQARLDALDGNDLRRLHATLMSERGLTTDQATAIIRTIVQRQQENNAART